MSTYCAWTRLSQARKGNQKTKNKVSCRGSWPFLSLTQIEHRNKQTYLSGLSGESWSSFSSSNTTGGKGFFGFFNADFRGFFVKLLSTDGVVSEVAAEPDTPLSCMISGTDLKEGRSFLFITVGISSSPVSEDSDSASASLGGSSSGVVSVKQDQRSQAGFFKRTS